MIDVDMLIANGRLPRKCARGSSEFSSISRSWAGQAGQRLVDADPRFVVAQFASLVKALSTEYPTLALIFCYGAITDLRNGHDGPGDSRVRIRS